MVRTEIKICGITEPAALDAAIGARADYCGFVFFAPSPRNLGLDQAAGLANRAQDAIRRVGVFVAPDDTLLREAVASAKLDALQIHDVTAARRAEIQARFGLPVWAVIAVRGPADIHTGHLEACDRVLFDAKTPHGSANPGGMGLRFDWGLLAGLRPAMPWGLAGGLTPDNVAGAIAQTGAPLVDTSSGVESAPGVKDPARIAAFCAAVRG